MGSSTQTATVLLPQFADLDKPTWRGDINDAMSKIDAAFVADRTHLGTLDSRTTDAFTAAAVAAWVKANLNTVYASKYLPAGAPTPATDLQALKDARDAAIARKAPLVVDDIGRDWTITDTFALDTLTDFSFHMEGRIKRADSSTQSPLIYIHACTRFKAGTIRTEGNVVNNKHDYSGVGTDIRWVNEGKHSLTIDGGSDIKIQRIHHVNPTGDGVYITNSADGIWVGHLETVSDVASGRNALSIVSGNNIMVGTLICRGTGEPSMPGGFDIEPDTGMSVSNVVIGHLEINTAGTSGISVYGAFRGSGTLGAGVAQIKNIALGNVLLNKLAGTKTSASDTNIRGVQALVISSIQHTSDPANNNQCLSLDDSLDVQMFVSYPRCGGNSAINIGFNATVKNLRLYGRVGSAAGSHCITIYNCDDSLIDMKLKNPANGSMVVTKAATGTSSNVVFRGDWRKDATGSWAMNVGGTVTEWLLDGVDMTGWPADGRVKGTNATAVERRNVKGLTYGTAAPIYDSWGVGNYVENTAPSELGTAGSKYVIRGWLCTAAGTPGTWVPVRALTGN